MGIQDSLCFDWNTDIWKVIAFPPVGTWSNYTQNAIFWEGWLFLSTCGPDTLGTPPIHWIQLRCTHWTPDAIIHIIYLWSKWPIMAQNGQTLLAKWQRLWPSLRRWWPSCVWGGFGYGIKCWTKMTDDGWRMADDGRPKPVNRWPQVTSPPQYLS